MSYNPNSRKVPVATNPAGSNFVGDDDSYSHFTPTATDIKGALSGIDTALGSMVSGANNFLSNLTSPTAINQSLLFGTDGSFNIGSASNFRPNSVFASAYLQIGTGSMTGGGQDVFLAENDGNGQTIGRIWNSGAGSSASSSIFVGAGAFTDRRWVGLSYYNATDTAQLRTSNGVTGGLQFATADGSVINGSLSQLGAWIFGQSSGGVNHTFNGGLKLTRMAVSGSTMINPNVTFIAMTGTSGGTLTLPLAATVGAGFLLEIKDEGGNAGTNIVTVQCSGSDTVDGVASIPISVNYGILRLYSSGTNWFTR